MTAAHAAMPSVGGPAGAGPAHTAAFHRGVRIDVSAMPAADRAHSRIVILLRDGAAQEPRVVEYVIDDGDPCSALDAGLDMAREAVETASRRPG